MIRTFLKDALIYTVPTILSRGIAIFLLPIYTRIATAGELGVLDLFLLFGNIIALTVALEISQAVARFIPEIEGITTRKIYNSTGLFFTFIMYFVFLTVAFYFSDKLNLFITSDKSNEDFFKLALVFIFLQGHYYYFQNLLRFEGRSAEYSIISVIYAVLNLLLVFIFGMVFDLGLKAVFYASILSVMVSSVLGLFFLKKNLVFKFDYSVLQKMLSYSVPLVPASVLIFVSLYVDRFMINYFLGAQSVGQYGVAVRLAGAASLIMIGFQMAITPLVFRYHDSPDTPNNISLIFRYFVVFATLFFLLYSFFVNEVLFIFTTKEYYSVSIVIPVLVLALLFSNMYVFMPGLAIKKKTIYFFYINLLVAILNVVLNYCFIPTFGIFGASIATCLGYFFAFVLCSFFSQRLYFVLHDWGKFILILFLVIGMVFLFFVYIARLDYYWSLGIRILFITVFVIVIFLCDLVRLADFKILVSAVSKKFIR